jgi:hypothetical protein
MVTCTVFCSSIFNLPLGKRLHSVAQQVKQVVIAVTRCCTCAGSSSLALGWRRRRRPTDLFVIVEGAEGGCIGRGTGFA